jgi:hypothetical protein
LKRRRNYTGLVDDWYSIGIAIGLGVASGVMAAALLGKVRFALVIALVVGAAAGAAIGFGFWNWDEAVGGAAGGLAGGFGGSQVTQGTLRRGGTAGATAILVGTGALALAGLAFLPGVGYAEGIVLPLLGIRLRRRTPQRYAGLRTLARD